MWCSHRPLSRKRDGPCPFQGIPCPEIRSSPCEPQLRVRRIRFFVISQTEQPIRFRPLKFPLSAFVVQDMMEFVQAHASYRFVISDEEQEKHRILVRSSFRFAPDSAHEYRPKDLAVQTKNSTGIYCNAAPHDPKECEYPCSKSAFQVVGSQRASNGYQKARLSI